MNRLGSKSLKIALSLIFLCSRITPVQAQGDYPQLIQKIETERRARLQVWEKLSSPQEKQVFLKTSWDFLATSIFQSLIPPWYGTPWDFNGVSETPGQGAIACGYFVTTILRDAGLKVERVRLAQQASENIIKSLVSEKQIKRFSDVPIKKFVQTVQDWGEGLYVVGLDIHVGFIWREKNEVYFIHSSYAEPYQVVKEKALDSTILASSRYRVLGKLSDDEALMEKWLKATPIRTR